MQTRRNLLVSTPALAVAVAYDPATAIELPRPSIEALFLRWRDAYTEFELDGLDSDESPAWERLSEIEDQIFEIEPATLREFAIKFLVAVNYESDCGMHVDCHLFANALAIVGMPKPYGHSDFVRDRNAGGSA